MNYPSPAGPTLRPATESDFPEIGRIFLEGLNLSVPGRRLADDFYDKERDVLAGGKVHNRLTRQLKEEHVWVAEHGETGTILGYVTWTDPRLLGKSESEENGSDVSDGEYKAAEVRLFAF